MGELTNRIKRAIREEPKPYRLEYDWKRADEKNFKGVQVWYRNQNGIDMDWRIPRFYISEPILQFRESENIDINEFKDLIEEDK